MFGSQVNFRVFLGNGGSGNRQHDISVDFCNQRGGNVGSSIAFVDCQLDFSAADHQIEHTGLYFGCGNGQMINGGGAFRLFNGNDV